MRKFLLFFLIPFFSYAALAQQLHFVYIQADNKQPFYVKTNNNLISSSSSGYAIVSKLKHGDYDFEIGFPNNQFPTQHINVTVNGDAGFALKNFGEKGWGLFDLQSLQTLMADKTNVKNNTTNSDNEFANVLADVSNAPELRNTEPVKNIEPKKEKIPEETPPAPAIETKTGIILLANSVDDTGHSLTYAAQNKTGKDTVIVFIPFDKNTNQPVAVKEPEVKPNVEAVIVNPNQQTELPVTVTPVNKGNEKFLDIEMNTPNNNNITKKENTVVAVNPVSKPVQNTNSSMLSFNSDCKAQATDDDFYSLRKKMAAQKDADNMTLQAKKIFKKKCFTTEQIKNLGALYLEEANKYDFYQSSYPFVSDPLNFPSLQTELTSDYLINRFKALIHL